MQVTKEQIEWAIRGAKERIIMCSFRPDCKESQFGLIKAKTDLFALRFLDKSMGEPSQAMLMQGALIGDCNSMTKATEIYKAMTQELLKEVGDE